jgi:glucarate dehydratase
MKAYDLADVEDATQGLEALARVRRSVNIPFSTHYTDIATILRLGSADTVVGDVHDRGGILGVKKLIAEAEGVNLGFWFHSSNELGISVAAMLHLIASTPHIVHPSQTVQIYLTDDIIQEHYEFQNGALNVPKKAGLGVSIDKRKLEKYSKLYDEIGEYKFFGFDPKKPKWFPRIPAW